MTAGEATLSDTFAQPRRLLCPGDRLDDPLGIVSLFLVDVARPPVQALGEVAGVTVVVGIKMERGVQV